MSDVIQHGVFKAKNKNLDYDTLYPENDTDDVLIGNTLSKLEVLDSNNKKATCKTISELLKVIVNRLNNRAVYNKLLTTDEINVVKPLPLLGQAIVDTDKGYMKVGDGKNKYNKLKYIKYIKN